MLTRRALVRGVTASARRARSSCQPLSDRQSGASTACAPTTPIAAGPVRPGGRGHDHRAHRAPPPAVSRAGSHACRRSSPYSVRSARRDRNAAPYRPRSPRADRAGRADGYRRVSPAASERVAASVMKAGVGRSPSPTQSGISPSRPRPYSMSVTMPLSGAAAASGRMG